MVSTLQVPVQSLSSFCVSADITRSSPSGSRATLTHKFGYVSLSLLTVIQQDTGVYTCRAVNQAGYDETTCRVSVGRELLARVGEESLGI